jgi:hypothetical protein
LKLQTNLGRLFNSKHTKRRFAVSHSSDISLTTISGGSWTLTAGTTAPKAGQSYTATLTTVKGGSFVSASGGIKLKSSSGFLRRKPNFLFILSLELNCLCLSASCK